MAYIELLNTSKTYKNGEKEFYALKNINVKINNGELVVILGPSGAGKSTLLNLLGGIDGATSGTIQVDDENIADYNENQLTNYRASSVGFIFQFYNLLPTLTTYENVALVADVTKNHADFHKVIKSVGLGQHLDKFPSELSGGEQQRVSIARALAKKPKLLLCDEPTGALDSKTGTHILEILANTCREDKNTVIIVTHNSLIAEIADRIIRLKNGEIESVKHNKDPRKICEVRW